MNTTKKTLFSEFPPITKEQWMEKVTIDLKGADFDKKLVWKNLSDIKIQPFYTIEDSIQPLQNTGENSQSIVNYRNILVETAEKGNKAALKAIEEGMNGLLFTIQTEIAVETLLQGIDLDKIAVSFNISSNEVAFATSFFDFVKTKFVKGFFNTSLISNYITTGKIDAEGFDKITQLIKLAEPFPNYKVITISGSEYLDSGANQVQEIAYTLNSLVFVVEQLTKKSIPVQTIFNNLNFCLAIGSEYFIEIGKFRAFQNLLTEIAAKYNVTEFSKTIHAKTSIWTKSITDAHTNLLRATTEAMSAILGNVDSILVDEFDKEFKNPSEFSSRIAGNITTILKEESYFGKVSNPVDGSYYIEEVTLKIAEKALELFKDIETKNGFKTSFENQTIQQQIAEIRLEKLKLISQRRTPIVGVNKYPNLMESVTATLLSKGGTENPKVLTPRRASLEIEALRRKTEELVAKTGIRPVVQLASYGNLTMRKARAAFAYDFLGISGFNVQQEDSFNSAEIAAEESAKSNSHIVVICSSDEDYNESAIEFIKKFKELNNNKVLLLAGAPTNLEELTKAGLDGVVNIKSDVLTTLSAIQDKVQKTLKS